MNYKINEPKTHSILRLNLDKDVRDQKSHEVTLIMLGVLVFLLSFLRLVVK